MRAALPLALAAALGAALACRHTHHVAGGEDERGQREGAASEAAPRAKEEQGGSGKATRSRLPPRAGRPAVASSPEGLMQPGSARRIQEALRGQGLLEEEPSGELDPATSAALRRFQRSQGLAETGAPDRETLRRLGVDPQDVYRTVEPGQEAKPPGG